VYNEPDNVAGQLGRKELEVPNKHIYSLALLRKVFQWSREVNPSQPLSCGIWRGNIEHWGTPDSLPELDRFMIQNSDFINFHAYDPYENVVKKVEELKKDAVIFKFQYILKEPNRKLEQDIRRLMIRHIVHIVKEHQNNVTP